MVIIKMQTSAKVLNDRKPSTVHTDSEMITLCHPDKRSEATVLDIT